MKLTIKRTGLMLVAILVLLAAAMPVDAANAKNSRTMIIAEDMVDFFTENIIKAAPWPIADLRVENFTIRPARIEVPSGTIEFQEISRVQGAYLGRKTVAAAILVNGKEEAQVKMIGDLTLLGDMVLLTRNIGRHEILKRNDCKIVRSDVSRLDSDRVLAIDQVVGKRLTTTLRAGAVLYARHLEQPPLVQRGELVTILAKTGGLTVTSKGQVKGAAGRGEMVRVKNLMSRRDIYARVVDSGLVEVDF